MIAKNQTNAISGPRKCGPRPWLVKPIKTTNAPANANARW